jgi:hypothetical protein
MENASPTPGVDYTRTFDGMDAWLNKLLLQPRYLTAPLFTASHHYVRERDTHFR